MVERANMTHEEVEEGQQLALDFGKLQRAAACGEGLVPVVAQDVDSGEVLIVGYANEEALNYTRREGVAAFWSTSRNECGSKARPRAMCSNWSKSASTANKIRCCTACGSKGRGRVTLWMQMVGRGWGVIIGGSWGMGWSRFEF